MVSARSSAQLSTAAAACGGFAVVRLLGRRYRLIAALPAPSSMAVSSSAEQCHVSSCHRRLKTDLLLTRYRPRSGETIRPTMAVRRWQKLQQIYVPSTDGSAVRTYLVTGSGYAAGSQRAYSLGSCATGQPDGRIVVALNAPLPQGGGIVICHISSLSIGNSAHYNVVHSCITVQ